jgi:inhibitor of KinA sporulation pathway (predicted exonuclease)
MEIIQIGLAFFDLHETQFIEKYSKYVRPKTNPILSQYCKNLLQIEQIVVDHADDCLSVFRDIEMLLNSHNKRSKSTCSWGNDREAITISAKHNSCLDPFRSIPSTDLSVVAAKKLCANDNIPTREQLRTLLGVTYPQNRHDALVDALDLKTLLDALIDRELY